MFFGSLGNTKSKEKRTCFTWRGKWEKPGTVLADKKVTLSWLVNSNMVKPEKFDYFHLVYHFTVPLREASKKKLFII